MTDVFESATTDSTTAEDQEASNSAEALAYVGDGRKYKSVDELDKAYAHAELHLKQLEAENEELRKRAEQAKSVDTILSKLEERNRQESATTEQAELPKSEGAVTSDDIIRVVEQREALKQQESNANNVRTALSERFGDKAKEVFEKRSEELGIDLNQLARVSPKAVLEFFPKQVGTPAPSPSGYQSVANTGPESGTYEHWKQMYRDGKCTREQMLKGQHKSLQSLGPEAFYKR